jgi:hypothetical protein
VTLPYDGLAWSLTKMPAIRASEAAGESELVLLDTGSTLGPVVTLDVVARRGLPAYTDDGIAYVESLDVGALTFRDFLARIWPETWEYRVLSIPIYRVSGWVMGIAFLREANYLCFDNVECEVTFGVEASFEPDAAWQWAEFPLPIIKGRPTATLPVAGVALDFLVDSAGGLELRLNRADWEAVAGELEVVGHRRGKWPTWGGFRTGDLYKVRELRLGPVVLEDEWVWVEPRREEGHGLSVIGLGPFRDTVVVFDFERSGLLIRTEPAAEAQSETEDGTR